MMRVQPVGGVIVGTLLATSVADTDATITSLAAVPAGLLRLNDVTVLAPLLPLVELRNPMTGIAGQVSGTGNLALDNVLRHGTSVRKY